MESVADGSHPGPSSQRVRDLTNRAGQVNIRNRRSARRNPLVSGRSAILPPHGVKARPVSSSTAPLPSESLGHPWRGQLADTRSLIHLALQMTNTKVYLHFFGKHQNPKVGLRRLVRWSSLLHNTPHKSCRSCTDTNPWGQYPVTVHKYQTITRCLALPEQPLTAEKCSIHRSSRS